MKRQLPVVARGDEAWALLVACSVLRGFDDELEGVRVHWEVEMIELTTGDYINPSQAVTCLVCFILFYFLPRPGS